VGVLCSGSRDVCVFRTIFAEGGRALEFHVPDALTDSRDNDPVALPSSFLQSRVGLSFREIPDVAAAAVTRCRLLVSHQCMSTECYTNRPPSLIFQCPGRDLNPHDP